VSKRALVRGHFSVYGEICIKKLRQLAPKPSTVKPCRPFPSTVKYLIDSKPHDPILQGHQAAPKTDRSR
jgi:hypothetical protein